MQLHPYYMLMGPKSDVLGAGVGVTVSTWDLYPQSSSYSYQVFLIYIYKVFQHLRQCLVVIRMYLQPDICSQGPRGVMMCLVQKLDPLLVL